MGLWRFEWRKLWKNPMLCGLILGCFLLNGFLVLRQTKSYDEAARCFPDTVRKVYEELSELPEEEQISWLHAELERTESAAAELEGMGDTDGLYERRNALNRVLENLQAVDGYEAYLTGMEEQANVISSSFLFGEGDVFSRRNAEQIPEKYRHLHGLELKGDNPQGVLLATESRMTDLILGVLIVLLAYFFLSMEREEGTMAFARCTRYGGTKLGRTKIAVIFAGSLACVLVLYGTNFAIAGAVYGFGDPGRGLQSVEGYLASPWKITVGGYLGLFLAAKLAAAAVVTGCVVWIVLWGKSLLGTSIVLVGVTAVEYVLWVSIPPHSWLDLAKQCNLFHFMESGKFFQSYETMNLLGYPVSSLLVCGVAGLLLLIVAVWVAGSSYERVSRGEYAQNKPKRRFLMRKKGQRAHSLLYYEAYKSLWLSGAGVLMAGCLLLQLAGASGERVYFSLDELYYKNYMKELEGEVTGEKLEVLREEEHRIAGMEEELYSLGQKGEELNEEELLTRSAALNRKLLCRNAFERVKEQAERIGRDGIFLDEVGYACLLDLRQQVYQAGQLLLLIVLAFYSVFIADKTAGMTSLWCTVPKGKKKIQKRKWALLAGSILFLCVAATAISAVYRMKAQGITALNVPLRYLPGFEAWTGVSVGGYLAGAAAVKVLLGMAACAGIRLISGKAKNATTVLLTAGSAVGAGYLLLWYLLLLR